jgi:maltose O-acetyltransferase
MPNLLQSAFNTAFTNLWMLTHRHRTGLITCAGKAPKLISGGKITIGRLGINGFIAPAQLGAAKGGSLEIGKNVFINQGATVVSHLSITIGDNVKIGDFVGIYDSDFHPIEPSTEIKKASVVIEDGVWIGRSAIILPGVTIGANAVVAAGSVVTKSVPPATLVAGVPAKEIRKLKTQEGWIRP